MSIDLEAIEARVNAATPGPWRWDAAPCNQEISLVTSHSGGYYVMGFERYGMRDAAPTFQVYEKYDGSVTERKSEGMVRADKLCKSIPGKEHHVGFDDYIDHPDAILIAHAPEDIKALLALVKQQAGEIETLRSELYPAKEIEERRAESWEAEKRLLQKTREQLSSVTAERDAAVEFIRFIDQNYSGYMEDSDRFDEWRGKYGRSSKNGN